MTAAAASESTPRTLSDCTHYQRGSVRVFNRAMRGLGPLARRRLDLSEGALLAVACRTTGLDDFGDGRFLPNLRVLLTALEGEADLNPAGRLMARHQILGSLKNRLRAQAVLARHPEIRERPITSPVVVVGAMRSGTTRVQRLLAADPRLVHLRMWELMNPAPRARRRTRGTDPRLRSALRAVKLLGWLNARNLEVHPTDAREAEEELGLLAHSFFGIQVEVQYRIPTFWQWCVESDQAASYEYMVDLIRLISWARGDDTGMPWVLKSPQHMMNLDLLLRVLPDAKIVFIHRDPLKTVASSCSLTWNLVVGTTDDVRPEWVGSQWMDRSEYQARRCIDLRDALVAPDRALDIEFTDMNRDWKAVMRRIYDFVDLEWTPESERALSGWLAKSEREHRHAGHRYALEDFGLDSGAVDERMMFYRSRFDVPYEDEAPARAETVVAQFESGGGLTRPDPPLP